MSEKIIFLGSILFGTIGGFAWSQLPSADHSPPPAAAPAPVVPPAATIVASTGAPDAEDEAWAERASRPVQAAAPVRTAPPNTYYAGCRAAWAAGVAPIYRGQPGYRPELDGDSDGIACEPYRGF